MVPGSAPSRADKDPSRIDGCGDHWASRTFPWSPEPQPGREQVSWIVRLYDGKQIFLAEVQVLALSGAFVAIDPPIPVGTGLSFWAPLPGELVPLLMRGHVRWTRSLRGPEGESVGVGIGFYEPDAPTGASLRRWLEPGHDRLPGSY